MKKKLGFSILSPQKTKPLLNSIKETWKLEPQNNSLAYVKYDIDYSGSFYQSNKTGRYFTIKKDFILQKFDEMMN